MAVKRMFSKHIVDSDAFLEMPLSTQALYFHLNMKADDDGFVGSPKRIMRMIGANEDEYKVLVAKKFVLEFDGSVCVIKHWLVHNTLRKDTYHESLYQDLKKKLYKKINNIYTFEKTGNLPLTESQLTVNAGKVREGKVSKEKTIVQEKRKPLYEKYAKEVKSVYPNSKDMTVLQIEEHFKKKKRTEKYLNDLLEGLKHYPKWFANATKDFPNRKHKDLKTFLNQEAWKVCLEKPDNQIVTIRTVG